LILEGLQVLDFTRLLPGPLCTRILGDYGAEVIKVEDPFTGDPTRAVGKPWRGSGSFFRELNRNKRSLAVNLKTEAGREIIKKLAGRCHVLVEGFRPGVMERLGLGYRQLRQLNPALVYASISGYGQDGPYRQRAGHDLNYTALSGLLELSAAPGSGPVMPAIQVADIGGGTLMALAGIMMALFARGRTGEGTHVDVSMTEGLLPWLTYAARALEDGEELPRRGASPLTGAFACYNLYRTADGGFMSLGALEPVFWQNFCRAVDRPEWIPRQFDPDGQEELIREVAGLFKSKSRAYWTSFFAGHDACCEPVLSLEEAAAHPLARARGFWVETEGEEGKGHRETGFPLRFNGAPGRRRIEPPRLGEHTVEILESLDYSGEEIRELRRLGAVAWP